MNKIFLLPVIIVVIAVCSCGSNEQSDVNKVDPEYKEHLTNVNNKLVRSEDEQIEDYIARYNWKMTKTGSGLRYFIYYNGNGLKSEAGMKATIKYKVDLISGVTVYDSEKDGLKSFEIGKAEVENGVEEAVMLMRVGDKAKVIIPSHLAFGLVGDDNKIPKRATLIYDLELVELF